MHLASAVDIELQKMWSGHKELLVRAPRVSGRLEAYIRPHLDRAFLICFPTYVGIVSPRADLLLEGRGAISHIIPSYWEVYVTFSKLNSLSSFSQAFLHLALFICTIVVCECPTYLWTLYFATEGTWTAFFVWYVSTGTTKRHPSHDGFQAAIQRQPRCPLGLACTDGAQSATQVGIAKGQRK